MAPERTSRKRQRTAEVSPKDLDDDNGKKSRGRPRVEGQDETAADRRRTQIRLAQRAYRQRKENTISTLKGQVSALQSTVEEMNKLFLSFNDKAVSSGILQGHPDLARELRDTTESFIQLAKGCGNNSDVDTGDSEHEPMHTEAALAPIVQQKNRPNPAAMQSVTTSQGPGVHIGLGYYEILDDASTNELTPPPMSTDVNYPQSMQLDTDILNTNPGLDYSNPNGDFINLAFTTPSDDTMALTSTTAYPVTLPTPPPIPQFNTNFTKTLRPPYTFSLDEKTFSRRLHRAALERAFHLLATSDMRPAAVQRVFRLSLLYHSKDMIMSKLRTILTKTTTDPLEFYHTPFIHLGGAGTHYTKGRIHNGYIIKPGPLPARARLQHVESGIDPGFDLEIDLNEYAGTWFDSNDVEGWLEEQGIVINPQQTFAEATVRADSVVGQLIDGPSRRSVEEVPDLGSPDAGKSSTSNSEGSPPTPEPVPELSNETMQLSTMRLFPELGGPDDLGWIGGNGSSAADASATAWLMGSGDRTPDFLNSGWNDVQWSSANPDDPFALNAFTMASTTPASVSAPMEKPATRTITVDVGRMIDEIIRRGVCLGRAPGFRKEDVVHALTSSVIQVV